MKKAYFFTVLLLITATFGCTIAALFLFNSSALCRHNFSQTVFAPTCEASGKTVYRCEKCSCEYDSDFTSPLGHHFSSVTVVPTCTSEGYTLSRCECGYSQVSDRLPPLEHDLFCEITAPSCTSQGYSLFTCSACSYSFKTNFTPPLGHSFSTEKHFPTAISAGYTLYTCGCSYSYEGDRVYYSDILESAYTDNTNVLSKGCDISRWNHQIDPAGGKYLPLDFKRMKDGGIDFVILKAGSTKSGIEPTFEMDYDDARRAGLDIGVYFYTYSATSEGTREDAELLLRILGGRQLEYPVYLDLEDPSLECLGKKALSDMCVSFSDVLQRNGYYTGLYTNHKWLTGILDTPKVTSLFDLWYARYPGIGTPKWDEEKYGRQLGMWQYTESGAIDGFEGVFDLNYSYKDYPEIMKRWGLNGY